MAKRQLISSNEAKPSNKQHTTPCSDCPMRKKSLPGWLGGADPKLYAMLAHSDQVVHCHAIKGPQCAGMAIYRANVAKQCDPPNLTLPKDCSNVFATPHEFLEHHSSLKVRKG